MELSIPEFAFAVLACSGFAVLAIALLSRWLHARVEARSLRARVICRLCLHAFEIDPHATRGGVVDCPSCGAANESR